MNTNIYRQYFSSTFIYNIAGDESVDTADDKLPRELTLAISLVGNDQRHVLVFTQSAVWKPVIWWLAIIPYLWLRKL